MQIYLNLKHFKEIIFFKEKVQVKKEKEGS
jgi:hypothetical protein